MSAWGRPLHDGASLRETDRRAIEERGVPGHVLMEAAGAAATRVLRSRHPSARAVLCACGGGNNGGDGLVVARRLRALGIAARCVLVAERPLGGDAAWAEAQARAAGVPIGGAAELAGELARADLIVDGLLGTGARGVPRGAVRAAIEAIAASGLPVLALDVPSGVDASTGEVPDVAIEARTTVAFHAEKIGLRVAPGLLRAGVVVPVAIGLPAAAEAPAPALLAGLDAVRALPARSRGGSKHDAGRVVVVGGSTGLTGAVALAAGAALRSGAGLVTACVPASLNAVLEQKLTEAMTRPCADDAGALLPSADAVVRPLALGADAVLVGPGCGRDARTAALVRGLCDLPVPLVLDADGLHALGAEPELLRGRAGATVLTPHAGEAARLLGTSRAAVGAARLASARALAARSGAVVVLKGPDTIIAEPDGRLALRDGDDPGLATGGAGDVLAGVTAALLARGVEPFHAACAAAAAHLAAARLAVAEAPGRVLVAGDLVDALRLGVAQEVPGTS